MTAKPSRAASDDYPPYQATSNRWRVGDLNARRRSSPIEQFVERWQIAGAIELPTIPAEQPRDQIDFVLYHPAQRWKVVEVTVIDEPVASDHRPILALLEWEENQ